jgi:iron complex outermembrane recepter protein
MIRRRALASAAIGAGLAAPGYAQPAGPPAEPEARPAPAPADADDPPEVGTTVVTGLRLPRPLRDVPGTVTVIGRAEIERSPRRTADDLVRTVPSAATFRRSSSLVADPTSQGANLRGVGPSGVSRALVLRDGIPLNDPFGGWVYWRAISLLDTERVEIAPGGASALFGNFALGGVVQLVSRRIAAREVEALASTGSYATHRAALRAAERRGDLGLALDAEVLDSAGYAPIAPAQRGAVDGAAPSTHVSVGARGEVSRGPSHGRGHLRWFEESLDAGTEHTTADVRTITGGAGWEYAPRAGTLEVAAFAGRQRFEQQRARVDEARQSAAPASRQHVPSTSQGASLTWTSAPIRGAGEHVLLVGADALRVAGTSHEELWPAMPMPTSLVGRTAGGEQRFGGLFVQDAARLGRGLDVSAALRLDAWQHRAGRRTLQREDGSEMVTDFPDRREVQVDPRLGVLQRLGEQVAVRASLYRGFRAPTLNELYRPFQVGTVLTDANAELRAETLWGGEAGAELVAGTLVARATGFWNELDRPIQNVTLAEPLPSGAARQRQNLGHAQIRGVELEASWRASARWLAIAGYTFVAPVVTEAPEHPDLVGKDLAQAPRHRATGTLTFDDPAIALVTVQTRLLGRQYEDDRNLLPMARFVVIDALAARPLRGGLSLFVAVENLLDRRYLVGRAGVDTIGQPRMIQAGVRYRSAD